ncbi:S8 family serine peptidase [Actinoplanes sp. TRM 88003]|uniref:S8 family serine peptidase n=1 Tax=Paractinoplanes aksuensis TaxID=2939490 RepID=A0ABT1E0H5_9ACTN|nr:S8 family serine peptidase [Actinoplanes aksuensis]MCO8275781.1 S8 family serine peptidase [Actinoplanes aksuensis]
MTVGLISTAVVVSMTSVTTWALAADEAGTTAAAANTPVRLIVGYKAGVAKAASAKSLSAAGLRTTDSATSQSTLAEINASRVTVSSGRSASVIAALRSDPNVAYVEKDVQLKEFDTIPNDPSFRVQNEMYAVKAPAAWDVTKGSGVVVAVIDTGVNPVGDLAGATVAGHDFVNNDKSPADDRGHGTSVAALIAARGNNGKGMAGVCWTCKIMPVKVLDNRGSGTASDVAQGIIWAVKNGARILNLSLGGPGSKVMQDAVAYANINNAVVVAAAGNEGNSIPQYPAAYPDVVTVAATNRCANFATQPACSVGWQTRTPYSSYNASGATWVDVAAVGDVMTMDRYGNYNTGTSGTSFSAPIVAGVAALVKTKNPSYTGWSIASSIYKGASARKVPGVTYGLVDASASFDIPTDTIAPTATGITPNGGFARGSIAVRPVNLKDDRSGIQKSLLYVNGVYKNYSRNAPYGIMFNTAGYSGKTNIELRIFDKANNQKVVKGVVTVDNKAPATKITYAPKSGTKLKGTVTIKFSGSDASGMGKWLLLINGKATQSRTVVKPFTFAATSAPSKFTVQVRGYDKAGNYTNSVKLSYTR